MRLHPRRAGGEAAATVTGTTEGQLQSIRLHVAPTWTGGFVIGDAYAAPAATSVFGPRTGVPPVRGSGLALATLATERAVDGYARATRKDAFRVRLAAAAPTQRALLEALAPAWEQEGHRGCAVSSGGTGFGEVCVVLDVVSADEVEVLCNVPELGHGRDAALVRVLAQATGLDPAAFTVAWGDPSATGDDAWGPVEAAANRAGDALNALGGPLREHVGTRVHGKAPLAPVGSAAVVVRLGAEGEVTAIHVAVPCGPEQDPLDVRRVAEGAAHMGLGVALSEEVAAVSGPNGELPETRFRMLGLLKSKVSPKIVGHVVVGGPAVDAADAALAATAAAVANAVSAFEGSGRASLPMKDSAAAKGVGVRLRPAPAT